MTVQPKRIQLRRTRDWRMPPGAIFVARRSIWGNPFVHPDRAQAAAAYRKLVEPGRAALVLKPGGLQFASNAHPNTLHWAYGEYVREHAPKVLRGHDLACWCPPGAPCHADVLLELANV